MPIDKNKLYTILLLACTAGYAWLVYSVIKLQSEKTSGDVCLIKLITNIPCPSCGSTRSVIALIHGDWLQAIYINPFGIIIALIMLIIPFWILFDTITKKITLLNFYRHTETFLKKPIIAIPLILFVLINWIWNITKGL